MDPEVAAAVREIDDARTTRNLILAEHISDWISAASRELNALAFSVLFDYPDLVEPLPPEQVNAFFRRYLLQAVRDNQATANVLSRYMAADALRAWFQRAWQRDPTDPILPLLRADFGSLLREGDRSVADSILTGILEHLFVRDDVRQFFSVWTSAAPGLAAAYEEAVRLATP